MNGSSSCAVFACDIIAASDHAMSTLGVSSSFCPTTDMTIYTDGSSSCIISAYDIAVVPDYVVSALDTLSSVCSLVDTTAGGTSPHSVMAAPVPLLLTSSMMSADAWPIG